MTPYYVRLDSMSCGTCKNLDRKIAAARRQRSVVPAILKGMRQSRVIQISLSEMIVHLGHCPHAKANQGSVAQDEPQ